MQTIEQAEVEKLLIARTQQVQQLTERNEKMVKALVTARDELTKVIQEAQTR